VITISTAAPTLRLTTKARVKTTMVVTASTDDDFIDTLIDASSAAISSYCHRVFARETLTELCAGYGDIYLALARAPVVEVTAVSRDGNVITDYTIGEAGEGTLYRRAGWTWTAQVFPGLTAGGLLTQGGYYLDMGTPVTRQEEPIFSITYTGGYVLPSQYLISVATVSASSVDNSFNDSASGFPALLKSGDVIEPSGFTNAGNNGRFLVTGTPTTAKIVVSATLTTEAAAAGRTVIFRPPPHVRSIDDVEKACIECVKTWLIERKDDPSAEEKQVGPMRVRYGSRGGNTVFTDPQGLPSVCIGLLRPWVRPA